MFNKKYTPDILSRFIFRQYIKRIQQFAFLDKLHRTFNDAFWRIYAFDARKVSSKRVLSVYAYLARAFRVKQKMI